MRSRGKNPLQKALLVVLGSLAASAGCSSGPAEPPYLASFSAFPGTIAKGQTSILSVYVRNASSVSISPGIGAVTETNIPVRPERTTTYTLTASNGKGTVTAEATVTVDAPAILIPPEDTTVVEGSTASFSVLGQGVSLSYQWQRNGADIAGATGDTYSTPAATGDDDGALFRVRVSDAGGGTVVSSEATMTVVASHTGRTYHVSPTGDDQQDGSATLPWRTIQKAADSLLPGDTVLVAPGSYDERVAVRRGGADGHPVLFQSLQPRAAQVKHGFAIHADDVRLSGFDITHDQGGWLENGIWLAGNRVVIEENYIHDVPGAGISPSWANDAGWHHVTIARNQLRRCSSGLSTSGHDWLVEGNEIARLVNAGGGDSDYTRVFGRRITFRGNHFHGTIEGEIGSSHVDGWQTFSNNGEFADDVLIEKNVVEDFHQGAMLEGAGLGRITFRNNLFVTRTWGGAWGICAGGTPNAEITALNNTFKVLYHGMGIRDSLGTGKLRAYNNIIYDGSSAYWGQEADVKGSKNLIFLQPPREADASDFPEDIVNADPLFVDASAFDFHLQATSPAVNNGLDMSGQVTEDLAGTARPLDGAWDIGAYEYSPPSP